MDNIYWLAWHLILAGQARRFWAVIDHFGSAKEAWQAQDREFGFLTDSHRENQDELMLRKRTLNLQNVERILQKNDYSIIFYQDSTYPVLLKNIFDPPPVLFLRGRVDCLSKVSVALVGSRRATPYGLSVAESLARELAGSGINVVSGMARGVDTAAHRGAIGAGGTTVAVLGCGIDVIYPRENGKIMSNIADTGAVISEFPPGTSPEPWHFPVRNRIISGLSKTIVVVEAAPKSGALITANVALEQGRDVMAVPGNVTSQLSRGPNNLIKQGAAPVTSAVDIIEYMGIGVIFSPADIESAGEIKISQQEKKLHDLLDYEPVSLEVLVQKSGLPPGEVMSALMFLEIKGYIRQLPGRLYARAK